MINKKNYHLRGVFFLGFTAISCQILLLREFIVSFYGNELSTGIVLGSWFFWTGLGGWLFRFIPDKMKSSLIVAGHILLSISIPATFYLLAFQRRYWGIPGQVLGINPILQTSLLSESAFCLISGGLFTLYCRLDYELSSRRDTSLGLVYFRDSLGAMAGGILFSFIFVHFLTPWQFIELLSLINLLVVILLSSAYSKKYQIISYFFLVIFLFSWLMGIFTYLEKQSRSLIWGETSIIAEKYTKYGQIVVTKMASQINFYENGLLLFTYPNKMESEENVHLAMLQSNSPKKILLLGGGLCGELSELKKYKTDLITYVELDPEIINSAKKFIPKFEDTIQNTKNLSINFGDARLFLDKTKEKYNLVLVSMPDPCNAQLNRFYTQEFFQKIKGVLEPNGIVSFKVTSSENYINREQARFLILERNTLKTVFDDVVIFPGNNNRFFASDGIKLTDKNSILEKRLKKLRLKTDFISSYFLPFELSAERMEYLQQTLDKASKNFEQINSDFAPVSYFFDMVLWNSKFSTPTSSKNIMSVLEFLKMRHYIFSILLLLLLSIIFSLFFSEKTLWFIGLPVAIIGFSEIALEIIIILAFQVLYGYAYYQLGILITFFMAGLSIGSYVIQKSPPQHHDKLTIMLLFYQILMALFCGLLLITFHFLSGLTVNLISLFSRLIFPLLVLATGFLGGVHFPLSGRVYLIKHKNIGTTVGWLYWLDLFGSAVGAVLLGIIMIPLLGIYQTITTIILLNLVAVITLMLYFFKR